MRKGEDKDGKIDLDKPGRLLGNWFHESLSVGDSSRGDPAAWAKQLCFAYDVHDPQAVRISIGGTIGPAGLYVLAPGGPDPADVGRETGLVNYRLRRVGGDGSGRYGKDVGTLLVQLLNEHALKIQYFAEEGLAEVNGFTDKANVYVR